MRIHEFVWAEDRIDHVARHGVTPEEVEEVCFGRPLVQRAKSEGENPVYYVLGQTNAGRYLFAVVIRFPDSKGYTVTARPMTDKERAPIPAMEGTMKTQRLPQTDSIQELAHFWDTHALTDFDDELEEVTGSVFEPATVIPLNLESDEAEAVRRMAEAKGIADAELIRGWVREKIHAG